MIKDKLVIKKEFDGTIKTVVRDGACIYYNKPESYYLENGYIIVTEEEFEPIQESYLNGICNNWKEIAEDQFEEMLNVLPPIRWSKGGFFMSERYTSDVTSFYQQIGDKYFTSWQRLSYKRDDILNSLNQFMKAQQTI